MMGRRGFESRCLVVWETQQVIRYRAENNDANALMLY